MDYISQIIETTIQSFDFTFCILVNILTYVVITLSNDTKFKITSTWSKRLVLFTSILVIGVIYYQTNSDIKLIINSSILAPVSWSWVFKPICKKFKMDYKHIDEVL